MSYATTHNDAYPSCPNCGHEDRDPYALGDSGVTECGGCGAEYHYQRHISVSYSAQLVHPAPDPKPLG